MRLGSKFAFWFLSWAILVLIGIFTPGYLGHDLIFIIIGILLIVYGIALNAVAGRTLKRYGNPKKMIPRKLVTKGIYSCMRHPAQFGSIFVGIGISFVTRNVFAILSSGWYVALALYFILSVEERETYKRFGKKYMDYARRVSPFRFWCHRE